MGEGRGRGTWAREMGKGGGLGAEQKEMVKNCTGQGFNHGQEAPNASTDTDDDDNDDNDDDNDADRNAQHSPTMSRNSEKSQSMLYRFREQQAAEMGIIDFNRARRPKAITSVDSVPACEKWRAQVLKEVGRKIIRIQEPALSEYQIRDLNDEINKLMREKHVWELQLKKLGGPNYLRSGGSGAQTVFDEQGNEVPVVIGQGGPGGYKYYGRARELSDVKELLLQQVSARKQQASQAADEKRLQQQYRSLPAEYYGLLEDADKTAYAALLVKEDEYAQHRFTQILNNAGETSSKEEETFTPVPDELLNVPSQAEMEEYLVDRLRQQIQDRYGLDGGDNATEATKATDN